MMPRAEILSQVLSLRLNQVTDRSKALLRRFEVDRAVAFAVLTRLWQSLTGPVTLLLMSRYFTPEVQGYYYTFASLLALQSFLELGFYLVIINVASHEWAHLELDENGHVVGSPDALSRLVSLGRLIFKWYAVASALLVAGVGTVGFLFFSQTPESAVHWQTQWWTLVLLTALLLWVLPFNSLLEGCNQVATINRFRFSEAILSTAALWAALALGAGLWAAVVAAAVKLLRDLYLILVQYRHFFAPFFTPPTGARMNWRAEILPMQWRLALSGVTSYFAFSLFNPVMFHYHGPVVAGQMGMTLMMVMAVQGMALAWIYPKVPRFGILIEQRDYAALDRFWLRTSLVSLAVAAIGAAAVWLLVYGLHAWQVSLAERLLPPLPTGLFLLAMILMQISQCETAYLRAHRQEPIDVLGVTSSLAIGLLVWLGGSRFGPLGAATGYLLVMSAALIWESLIWYRCRARWHAD